MTDEASGNLVERWRAGDQQAAAELFQRYAGQLVALARSRLSARLAQRFDAEDVVQSAYRSFFGDTRDGRYEIERGGDLWHLLVTITLHKLQLQVKRNNRKKRAVNREVNIGSEDSLHGIEAYLLTHEPSPMEAVALSDELEQLMRRLGSLERRVLELRLQGHNLEDIAAAVDRTQRTVIRVLERIKQHMQRLRRENPEP